MGEPAPRRVSYEQYHAIERETDVRHEFIDGAVYAMAGGTPEHAALAARVIAALARGLGRGPCIAAGSDLKVYIPSARRSTYPDAAVVCGPFARADHDRNAVTNPKVLVEVLSDGTEADDRGEKFRDYATLASLEEYSLVGQHAPRIEVFRRNADGSWTLRVFEPGATVRLESVPAVFTVDEIYAGIELPPRAPRPRLVTPSSGS